MNLRGQKTVDRAQRIEPGQADLSSDFCFLSSDSLVMLVLAFHLVRQDLAVMANDSAGNGAVVVLMLNDPTAATVEPLVADQAVFVLILEVLAVHDAAARGPFIV